jgi:hypothetical protein
LSGPLIRHATGGLFHLENIWQVHIMFRLLYVSSAIKPFSKSELADLLVVSRVNNSQYDITGMLLYKDGNFLQVLEGEEAAVRKLYEKISCDPRHTDRSVLFDEEIAEPLFRDWSMGFRDLGDSDIRNLPGFSPFMNRSLTAHDLKDDLSGCLEMLTFFRASR